MAPKLSRIGEDEHASPRILSLVYFGLFDNCNAKCNMCSCWTSPRIALDITHYERAMASVLSASPTAIRFTGGEPLLLKSIDILIRMARGGGASVTVISNGRLLASRARTIADAGCSEVVISVDGDRRGHDTVRGTHGLYERCLAGIRSVVSEGMTYGINTVLQRATIDDLPTLGAMLMALPTPPRWWHLIPVRDSLELAPTADQRARYLSVLPKLLAAADAAGVALLADASAFDRFTASGCGVPQFAAYVRADSGDVFACNMLAYTGASLGNLHDASLKEVLGGPTAAAARTACISGVNAGCLRCDASSQAMNYFLRKQPVQFN